MTGRQPFDWRAVFAFATGQLRDPPRDSTETGTPVMFASPAAYIWLKEAAQWPPTPRAAVGMAGDANGVRTHVLCESEGER